MNTSPDTLQKHKWSNKNIWVIISIRKHTPLCVHTQQFVCFHCSDPFFPLSFLVNSWFPGTLDTFFQALFLCALLLFWLCVYHGIRVQVGTVLICSFSDFLPFLVHQHESFILVFCFCRVRGNFWLSTCLSWLSLVFCGCQQLLWAYGKRKHDLQIEPSSVNLWFICVPNKQTKLYSIWIFRVNELQDPTYQYKVDIANFQVRLLPLAFL